MVHSLNLLLGPEPCLHFQYFVLLNSHSSDFPGSRVVKTQDDQIWVIKRSLKKLFLLLIFGSAKSFKTDNVLLKLLRDCLLTLNDFQKLLGDINWICPHLKLTFVDLKPFV